jgi:mannosyltransferase OCH1-like enzyme
MESGADIDREGTIPLIIHQSWKSEKVPADLIGNVDSWRKFTHMGTLD